MPPDLRAEVQKLRTWLTANAWIDEYNYWWSEGGVVSALQHFLAHVQPQDWSEDDVTDLLYLLEQSSTIDTRYIAKLVTQSEPMAVAITKHALARGGVACARLAEHEKRCVQLRDEAELLAMNMVRINANLIVDSDSFHAVFADVFGFPKFYGRNMNAWIDCMGYLDEPSAEMCSVHVTPGRTLALIIDDASSFKERCPALFDALVECSGFVNWRRIEANRPPLLALAM